MLLWDLRFKWFIWLERVLIATYTARRTKNNVHISPEKHWFPVPQIHSSVHPRNRYHKTASVVGRGGGGGGERGAPLKGRGWWWEEEGGGWGKYHSFERKGVMVGVRAVSDSVLIWDCVCLHSFFTIINCSSPRWRLLSSLHYRPFSVCARSSVPEKKRIRDCLPLCLWFNRLLPGQRKVLRP